MNRILVNRFNRLTSSEEQLLYEHLLGRVEVEDVYQLIERFRLLFIQASGYPDREVTKALETIVSSQISEQDFNFILNRCCHILINRWHTSPNRKEAIAQLIQLFESSVSSTTKTNSYYRRTKKIAAFVHNFIESEQYLALKRFAEVICQSPDYHSEKFKTQPLRTLIPRYPYLYKHCLLSEDSSYEHQQMIRQIQVQKQRKFELDLSQYAAHQWRRVELARSGFSEQAKQIVPPIPNPTLLSDKELFLTLKQFVGKVEGGETYRDLAQRFLNHTSTRCSYRDFKDDFYEYLTPTSFDSTYIKRQFNDKIYKQLQNTIPHSDDELFNDSLLLRTCSQMLNFLVVESPQKPSHFVFIDLIANLGPTLTVGLLLKIVLLCRKVKPYLEKRFAILFNHYEASSQDGVQWLVKVLEILNIALSANFGGVDLSFIR